jgi:hypothetical protein
MVNLTEQLLTFVTDFSFKIIPARKDSVITIRMFLRGPPSKTC